MKKSILWVLLGMLAQHVIAQDWPDWRGNGRNGLWEAGTAVKTFSSDTIEVKWSQPIAPGYSGPTVAHGKVYVTDRIGKPTPMERVLCFDERSGKPLWDYSYECSYENIGYPAGPRTSVVVKGGKAYTLGAVGHLYCFEASSGKVLWERDLNKEYEIDMPIWGMASTPLVVDEMLIVQVSAKAGAGVVAFNRDNGEEIWRSLEDRAGYSAPILIEKNGIRVVVNWTEHSLSGVDPESGELFWRIPWTTGSGMSIATPVLYKDHIFVSAFYSGSLLVKLGDDYRSAEKVWQRSGESERKTDALHCVMNTPVIIDNFIYGVDSYGELRCLDFDSGDRVWEDQTAVKRGRWANIHFIQVGDRTWMFNEQGELLITQLSPEGFYEISRAHLIEPTRKQLARGVSWSHPAFANGHVFIRNDERLICADLSP